MMNRGTHCHVERNWYDETWSIWFLTRTHLARFSDGALTWIPQAEGARLPEPTLKLQEDMYRALIEAGLDILPPSAATDKHLNDSITVRDRLLTLVEKGLE